MKEDRLSEFYSGTEILIRRRDRIDLDGHEGIIKEVFKAGAEMAKAYGCEQTGGLMIRLDSGALIVEPFGCCGFIKKVPASSPAKRKA